MKFMDALRPDLIERSSEISTRDEVLRRIAEMVSGIKDSGSTTADEIYEALTCRESLGSTGFGHGVAIPHCRLSEAEGFMVGLITTTGGVDFDSIDGEKVRIIPFVVGPETEPKEYLKLLSAIAQLLRSSKVRKDLTAQESPADIYRYIGEQISPDDKEPRRRPGQKMMHVFIQNEELFDEILQIFTGSESVSAMVLEAHESTDYLMKGPFFAGFWDSSVQRFNRLIIAVIRDELVNSTVRSIEYACGKLTDRDDILVTVTDLHYTLGSLSL